MSCASSKILTCRGPLVADVARRNVTVRGPGVAAVESCWLTTVTNVVPIREISHSVRSLSVGRDWYPVRQSVHRVRALAHTRILLAAARYLVWTVNLCAVKNVRARAREPRKNPLFEQNDNVVTITSIRFSQASDSFYFFFVRLVHPYFVYLLIATTESNSKMPFSTGKYVSLKPSDSDLWTKSNGWKARWIAPRKKRHADLNSGWKTGAGSVCPSAIVSPFLVIGYQVFTS